MKSVALLIAEKKTLAILSAKLQQTMKDQLRSQGWFGKTGKDGFIYRAWMKNQGIPDYEFRGKLVIGICNTWSELTPCNAHFS